MLRGLRSRSQTLASLFGFLWARRLYWMIPVLLLLFAAGLVVLLAVQSPLSPFVYTLF